eukprot:CAMPEP_0113670648 /NCGR_PEP_ID=MMETSP0038_2-20120614/5256_1 /TAXON_ID=2898 /ORGANISM="Cryptomonas paramecium" /LENGTH=68 /DNA_ID=CAMNT_0000586693 /DNA_START=310 /DNA_END=513 /DNA_ORIENTATION=- /assembly_acc=CAM_ASM_000170
MTTQDGWTSTFQYKSCSPYPTDDTGTATVAFYDADYCTTDTFQLAPAECASQTSAGGPGTPCARTTTR